MSSPESRPSAWLAPPVLLAAALTLGGWLVTWGAVSTRVEGTERTQLEQRSSSQALVSEVGTLRVRVASLEAESVGTRRLLDTEVAGLRREVERLARAVEQLTQHRR